MLVFIVNPNSGGEKGFQSWKKVERHLNKKNIEYKVYITDHKGQAVKLANMATKDETVPVTLVGVGGDGTFNDVVNGARLGDNVTIGFIPVGTGNDFARGMGLSKDPITAVDRIIKCEKIREIDYGVLSYGEDEIINRRFAITCGIGFDAAVCETLENSSLRRRLAPMKLQKTAYQMFGALEMLKCRPSKGYLLLDGEQKVEFNDIDFVACHNQPTEGGGYYFSPQADPEDGRVSLCIVHTKNKIHFSKILLAAKAGNHLKYQGVRNYDCKNVRIHLDKPMALHADGEVLGQHRDIEVHCVEKKLRVIV